MEAQVQQPQLVEKEVIPAMHFAKQDVLTDPIAKARRRRNAHQATLLGNGYHHKVYITFRNAEGELFQVNTTIWEADDEFISLKCGTVLPLKTIVDIEFNTLAQSA